MSEENITRLTVNNKEVILIGTAHVSKRSVEQVKEVIEAENPDSVCVELDEQRYQSVMQDNQWKDMDIFKVIKEKKASLLLMNMLLSSFQKRMAKQMGVKPGQEMIQGIESAEETGAELVLADRNIQVTFARIWGRVGIWGKAKLMVSVFGSILNNEQITEEELERMKSEDMLNSAMEEITKAFPGLKTPLIDERDQYLAQKIKDAPGEKVVAVLGAAHVPGIKEQLYAEQDLDALNERPPKSKAPKFFAWAIPAMIIAIIAATLITNPAAGMQQIVSWLLWNGSFAALGALLAFGHPAAVATAFVVSPLSSLSPLLAAGWFAGMAQTYFRRPHVTDFEELSEDVYSFKGFKNNKVTRILLVVIFSNIGSTIGSLVGGADVIRLFLQNFF
ncbi:TraB/GumN family protein [Salisediminibacterium halotolerans]|uniref:TraB/GumN family protein n=1 Tax=Salisediminibacterium halotolerans TaxID=517425 RepID=UPI000EAEA8FF|nr:TraB/GumN family protein [Salisediminibacterium halotolerans]RLJ74122.1 pheromone shutdown-related protein TraB [Actinophytocola xinjiangensis]RPE87785.1 pheromone shutdown-related protein TraB [Salisediminibacterium halotolerans]TWG34959.1 pheromone shutdown-related protein TraB [Salisediminibacterium halotolerans]GEL07707.1 conjugal transfer protein TraB [Salisediminibacterium halotolerans]